MTKGKNSNSNSNIKTSSVKKVSQKKIKKETIEITSAPIPTPVKIQVEAPVIEPQDISGEKYNNQFTIMISELQQWRSNITNMISTVRNLQRCVEKEVRNSNKKSKKQLNKPKREPSGFAKPTEISKDLCDFLGKTYGTEMARTEVTKYLTQYIKQHNLQEPADKRKIKPDPKLSKLLGCSKTDEVTYFNLQKWMKPHFAAATSN